jgi:hypothetical protein
MKKLFVLLAITLFCFTSVAVADAGMLVQAVATGGGGTQKWVGYPNSSGTPDDGSASWGGYGSDDDRSYFREWTATEDGTIQALNVRFASPTSAPGEYSWYCVWNGTTLVAYLAIGETYSEGDWTGYQTLNVADGQSLDFSTNDVIRSGVSYEFSSSGGGQLLGVDSTRSSSIYYDSTTSITATPPTTISVSGPSGSYNGLGVIMRYVTR